jgi:hypothetical protein
MVGRSGSVFNVGLLERAPIAVLSNLWLLEKAEPWSNVECVIRADNRSAKAFEPSTSGACTGGPRRTGLI